MTNLKNIHNVVKIFYIFSLFSIIFILSRIYNLNNGSYESSIYDNIHNYLSVFFSLLIVAIFAILFNISRKNVRYNFITLNLILIILINSIFLSLYLIKNYYLYCALGDPGFHLGWVKDLLENGFVNEQNFYPITHIYAVEICHILQVEPSIPLKILPFIYAELSFLFLYILSFYVMPDKDSALLAVLLGTPLIGGWYLNFSPNVLSNLAFPFAIYVLFKSYFINSAEFKILFVILAILFPAFHIVPTLGIFAILLSILVIGAFSNEGFKERFIIPTLIIIPIISIAWISSFGIWETAIFNIHRLIHEGGPTSISYLSSGMVYAENYGFNVILYALKIYGGYILYFIASLIALPIVWQNREKNTKLNKIMIIYLSLFAIAIAIIVLLFGNFPFGPLRLLVYLYILSIFPAGILLHKLLSSKRDINFIYVLITGILISVISMNYLLCLYPSPYTLNPNVQTTMSEVAGIKWLFFEKNRDKEFAAWHFDPSTYAGFLTPQAERNIRADITPYRTRSFPDHFGYNATNNMGNHYKKDAYLIVTDLVKRLYIDVYPSLAKYRLLPSDFAKLHNDSTVDDLYDNGGVESYYVHSKGGLA